MSDVCKLLFSIPQGSVLGPLLFSLCISPLSLIISKHKGIKFHFSADDSHVYVHLSQKNACAAFEQMNRCLDDVTEWMSISKLKLNPDKTEFILSGLKRQRDKLKACFPIDIFALLTKLRIWVCGLIQIFPCLSMFRISANVVLLKLIDFRHVRRFLTHDVSVLVANAVVSSHLDYCNSFFRSLSKFNLCKLQCIQNSAARIV